MHTATYSPEDNKIRLYVGRVPRGDYERLRAAGFVSTPKQDCDFVATWTPHREDLAREYLDDDEDIGDEDYSPQERSADRAERFEGYRDKRTTEAVGSADTFEAGPQAFGHQNRARAERQARRHDRKRTYAVSQWSKAEYWQTRTAGVIAHALYRSSPGVRRGRILTLESELRKNEASRKQYAAKFAAWSKVPTLEGADTPLSFTEGYNEPKDGVTIMHLPRQIEPTPAGKLAYALANCGGCWGEYTHPRKERPASSLHTLLTLSEDPITPREAAALWLANAATPGNPESSSARWARHYELRLTYERAMLAAEGGSASEADMEPGGWIQIPRSESWRGQYERNAEGWSQIQKVNKSNTTGRVVSVGVYGTDRFANDMSRRIRLVNVERAGHDIYRAPTDEERAAFARDSEERKAKEKATKPKEPSLINPTDEDAERLQARWNVMAKANHEKRRKENYCLRDFEPVPVLKMTQAQYSAISKGSYAKAETRTIHECGKPSRQSSNMWTSDGRTYDKSLGKALFKLRMYGYCWQVIVIIDKPQKPLPLDWDNLDVVKVEMPEQKPTTAKVVEGVQS